MDFKFSVFPYNVARILLYYPHNRLSTLCAYYILPVALNILKRTEAVVICGGSWVIFKPSTTHPSGSDTGFHGSLITLKSNLLGCTAIRITQQPESCQYNCFRLFHTILTSSLFSAGHRHHCFYHFQSGSLSTQRNIFLRKQSGDQKLFSSFLGQQQ